MEEAKEALVNRTLPDEYLRGMIRAFREVLNIELSEVTEEDINELQS